jgi:hypothetical protein
MRARAEFRNWTPEGWRDAIDLSGNLEEDVAEGVRFARRAIEREKRPGRAVDGRLDNFNLERRSRDGPQCY